MMIPAWTILAGLMFPSTFLLRGSLAPFDKFWESVPPIGHGLRFWAVNVVAEAPAIAAMFEFRRKHAEENAS